MSIILPAVHRMQLDAARLHGVAVSINQSERKPVQAQMFHICHMFLHNYFKHLHPKVLEPGARTIAWSHLSDSAVSWDLIDDQKNQFLLTRDGQPARPGLPADRQASAAAMARFLSDHGVKSMAAPGIKGCGKPCLCGGHASKHLTGEACDLSNLPLLGHSIRMVASFADDDAAVDSFLHEYGLWRPLAHLDGKARERWHVEGIPPQSRHLSSDGLKTHAKHHGVVASCH
jgi:hypothetical protein